MHAIRATRQKCRPKHQILILKCYPRTTKGAIDVKPNASELSYLLYYATTRRSKVQKVGAFLEKKTASDVYRARVGNVQVTLQILEALIEKAPRDLPLYAGYVLKVLNIILRSRDITMVESSTATFSSFCEHHDGASLSADQEYLKQYEEIVRMYAAFASTQTAQLKDQPSAPVAMRWRTAGLEALKSIASSDALASPAGRQTHVIVPTLLENLWTDNVDFLDLLEHRAQMGEKADTEKMLRRHTSVSTVQTVEPAEVPLSLSHTSADADKVAEEDLAVLAMQCLKSVFVVNNRSQIHAATRETLNFISERVSQNDQVLHSATNPQSEGWATRMFDLIARWTPVQDRYVILVTAMDVLVRSPISNGTLQQQLVLVAMVDSLLKSDINLIGLSVMDVLLGLVQHVLRVLQLQGALPHKQEINDTGVSKKDMAEPAASVLGASQTAATPTGIRVQLLALLQGCIGDLATHVYYADQISDMVAVILGRLKPSVLSSVSSPLAAIENPAAASGTIPAVGDFIEDPSPDSFFSFATAKVNALQAIKNIILVASNKKTMAGGSLSRNRVPVKVWEGTQWLLRDADGNVRKAYTDALLTWLEREVTGADLRIHEVKGKTGPLKRTSRDDSGTNLAKRAVSNASVRDKTQKPSRSTFLDLLHLAVYENALQHVESEADIVLLHLLLNRLVHQLGVNAVVHGLPMVFRLQEDILEAETPTAKIRLGSLCHGYFWTLSSRFDFETSAVGFAILNEIDRRRKKSFWVNHISVPTIPLSKIGIPGSTTSHQAPPIEQLVTESLLPFDDRFQMVKLITLSYADGFGVPSAPTSPGRSVSQPILTTAVPTSVPQATYQTVPEVIKESMMVQWTRESATAAAQETSKSASMNGSRAGTNARNFLAVNGNLNGSNGGTKSPHGHHHKEQSHKSLQNSAYGLVGGLGSLQKIRQGSTPPSDSNQAPVTRVDALRRILSGQQSGPPISRSGKAYSDASSESMESYDFTASDVSYNPNAAAQTNLSPAECSASLREPRQRSRSRSKSVDRMSPDDQPRALASYPDHTPSDSTGEVPPVPPIPIDVAEGQPVHKSRSVKRTGTKSRKANGSESGTVTSFFGDEKEPVDLESLLKGIDVSDDAKVVKPPY
ncbi:hypothetical protein BJ878DRAFT_80113 [Calycina marina]|uniref:Protein EFR3 n=1 Tax=Calycina marina TaxID=1763456 RepID=A0A9P7Z2N6_9HELO|nr:hypothetical protein BJ878DRAFT_80113 [Calycina marina]